MVDVERLLADCLRDAQTVPMGCVPLVGEGFSYASARHTFLVAGLRALRDQSPEGRWVQLNLSPDRPHWPTLYGEVARTARELLATRLADDFFFMHKPPGLRVRFRVADATRADALHAELLRRHEARGEHGARVVGGVYEPETYLFGGPRSMPWVHALFTADSLAWLDVHAGAEPPAGPPPTAWRVSLLLLREVFEGLGIVGWEHRGVWQVLQDEIGRRLPDGLDAAARERAAAGIRDAWAQPPGRLLDGLDPHWQRCLDEHREALHRAAVRWRIGYFESGHAHTGPRHAAAHLVIFHWNRGRFSLARQGLLTEALLAPARVADVEPPAPAPTTGPDPRPTKGV